jgi:outer membrane protein OmpA-like peptidoglycan-associated protein
MKMLIFFLLFAPTLLSAQNGLIAEYYDGKDFNDKKVTRNEAAIDFNWDDKAPAKDINLNEFSARWTGQLNPPVSGEYIFFIRVDDGARLFINGKKVIDAWDLHDSETFDGKIYLDKNQTYELKVEYFNALIEGEIHLTWQLPTEKPLFGGLMGYNEKKIDSKYFKSIPNQQPKPEASKIEIQPSPLPKPVLEKPKKVKPKPQTPPKPEPTPEVAPVSKEMIESYLPKNILFVKSKSIMEEGSYAELDRLADMLLKYPALKVSIAGHTDNVGNAEKNLILSEERAKVVADYLISKGIDATRVSSKGYGSTRPIYTPGENAKNRRVEFVVE